jgi:hypothetical protein
MKKLLMLILISTLLLSACSSAATSDAASGDTYTSPNLPVDYEGALPVRTQLALGTLMLIGTDQVPTAEQAQELIILWQALRGTQTSSGVAQEEISALLGQIEDNLTQDQLDEIRDMQLTNADMQTWAAENGIAMGAGGGQGAGKNLSPEARATRQAEEGRTPTGSSGSGGSAAIIDALIESLQGLVP